MSKELDAMYDSHQLLLSSIHKKWKYVPALRVAQGIDDAARDWPIASFGTDDRYETSEEAWLCTDQVRGSDFLLTCQEVAEVLAKAPNDIRVLFSIITELREALNGK